MSDAVHALASEAGWRLRALLRTSRFYSVASLVRLYKCHILSFLEGATSAIYHAAPAILRQLDELQATFLDTVGLSSTDALLKHNLAPLQMRRDIAMLGVLYKVAHQTAPAPIQTLFSLQPATLERYGFPCPGLKHKFQILDPVAFDHPVMIKRSIFGLIRIFNHLAEDTVAVRDVKLFQKALQLRAKAAARNGCPHWEDFYHADC